ncbi:unnamed protein product [Porites lobata]|uniref:Uncharacterized protein n=1 Tax=Porites lobata TaxID=104759 RepID=A0ABN8NQA5_9CNID|nr:unnamed protein product [Porites lobata]
MSEPGTEDPDFVHEHLHVLQERSHQVRIFHINTQSMASSFVELLATIDEHIKMLLGVLFRSELIQKPPNVAQYSREIIRPVECSLEWYYCRYR